ncbi:MAG: uroporphyrinogen decarboxylase family protein [Dehalococcoidia bacterium]|nr:uroporphyrinogen decarboxylase family protein [Dehalococcoidia bacterium]
MTADTIDTRLARVKAAIDLKPPDHTPVCLSLDYKFVYRYKGLKQADYFRNRGLGGRSGSSLFIDVFNELGGWDFVGAGGNTTRVRDILEAPMIIRVPGKDIPEDEVIQWEEVEVLTHEHYDQIIKVGWIKFMDDFYPRFRGYDPAEYRARIDARAVKELAAMKPGQEMWNRMGYPVQGGGDVFSPLMMLSTARTMIKFTVDLYRIPDKVQAVMDAMIDDLITLSIKACKAAGVGGPYGIPTKSVILERGGGFVYPLKIFERFEFPYLKKMVNAFVNEGITPILHFDSDWTLNMPYLKELPHRKFFIQLDSKTDIFKTKEILRDTCCIMGDVAPSLLSLGTKEEVGAYCRKLIDVVGKGGGLILGVGCGVPVDSKFENLKMMIDTAREYNPHHT